MPLWTAVRPTGRKWLVVRSGGKHAVTHYREIDRLPHPPAQSIVSLIECRLETGRTHQIRVHMAHIGHPVLGGPHLWLGLCRKHLQTYA